MNPFTNWYFDLVSPFAYLHLKQFHRLPPTFRFEYVPILFAAILKRWEHRGPAEIPPKRLYTYRHVIWLAKQMDVPLTFPPSHPFNPLQALRLLVAAGPTREKVTTAFDMIWTEGRDLQDPAELAELGRRLHIANLKAALEDDGVKRQLRTNTDEAIGRGVFGVPTFVVNNQLFWGADSLDMMLDYLRDPKLFDSPEMRRVATLPVGAVRPEIHAS